MGEKCADIKTRGFATGETQWHSSSGRWCEGGAVRRAATCLPHPWQERPPRARTSPPGGWSSPVKRTCQQTTPPPLGEQSLGRRLEAQKSFTRGHFWSVPVSKIPDKTELQVLTSLSNFR